MRVVVISALMLSFVFIVFGVVKYVSHNHGGTQMEMPPHGYRTTPIGEDKTPTSVAYAAVGNKIGKTELVDQNGKPFDLSAWFDKPMIISYIFTSCDMVCPAITGSLASFVEDNKELLGRDFRVVSVGFDNENDTPEAMREYGKSFVDNFDNWVFATGSADVVKALSEKLGIMYEKTEEAMEMHAGMDHGDMKMDPAMMWKHTMAVTVVGLGGVVTAQIFGTDYTHEDLAKPISAALKN